MHVLSKRRVKIVGTLGPSSDQAPVLSKLIRAGLDVARLNFSHGSHDYHTKLAKLVRKTAQAENRIVALLQDLQGPKLRLGMLPDSGVEIAAGDEVILFPEGTAVPKGKALPLNAEIAQAVIRDAKVGAPVKFDDGKLSAIVKKSGRSVMTVEFEVGGVLTSRKGINLPGSPLKIDTTTEKDLEDLKLGLSLGVDAVALSFVRTARDIEVVRKAIKSQSGARPLLFAKIERGEALHNLDAILNASDGVLVARGDMAVEIGADQVPVVQKKLIHACAFRGIPVITATQMLESMVTSTTPTRAEASDVANAVFDGTDAVMLSAETASGKYPVEVVTTMAKIVMGAEKVRGLYTHRPEVQPAKDSVVESIEFSASRIANHVGATAIACITHSGMAARMLAKFRPDRPIVAVMDSEESLRRLAFVWGVHGVVLPKIVPTDDAFQIVEAVMKQFRGIGDGATIVITAGVPTLGRGTTNMVKVHRIGAREARKI